MPEPHHYKSWFMTITVFSAVLMIVMVAVSALMLLLPGEGRFPCVFAQHRSECEALVALYKTSGGEDWNFNEGWLKSLDICEWEAVSCDFGYVIGLELASNNLSGNVPPELGNLGSLRQLDLSDNGLTTLPAEIGKLRSLQELHLANNEVEGLPLEFGNLSKLAVLTLGGNDLTSLPAEIGNLGNLQILMLMDNMLENLPPEIGNLSSLQFLNLQNNELPSLPVEIGNLSSLQLLLVDGNPLTCVPAGVAHLVDDLPACEE